MFQKTVVHCHRTGVPPLNLASSIPLLAASLEQTEPSVAIIIFLKVTFPMQNPHLFIHLQEI
jgi:hypothetical protein